MKIKVSRIRHPLACFQGEITVNKEKTSTAEEIKLAFDYYPVIDGQLSTEAKPVAVQNGNGHESEETVTNGTVGEKGRNDSPFRQIRLG